MYVYLSLTTHTHPHTGQDDVYAERPGDCHPVLPYGWDGDDDGITTDCLGSFKSSSSVSYRGLITRWLEKASLSDCKERGIYYGASGEKSVV